MPPSRAFAAHFATVALLQPGRRAASFQLAPLSSCRMISFFVAIRAPFRTGGRPGGALAAQKGI